MRHGSSKLPTGFVLGVSMTDFCDSPQTMYRQIAPDGVTKVLTTKSGNLHLGMEDDSAKREYGTHPEDPGSEGSSSEGDSPRQVSPPASRKGPLQTGGSPIPQECPFIRPGGKGS